MYFLASYVCTYASILQQKSSIIHSNIKGDAKAISTPFIALQLPEQNLHTPISCKELGYKKV